MSEMMHAPDGWEVKKLGEIAKFKGGDGFSEDYQGLENGDYPFLKVSDMNLVGNELYITKANNYVDSILQKELKYTLFPKETIIFAKVGAALLLNRRRVLTKDSIIDNNMMGSIVKNNFSFEYLYYILCSIDFANYVQTGALPSINQETIANIIIKTPKEKKEQEKIAKILSTLDKNIESTNRLIEKEKNIKKAMMQELLTNGIDEDGHIRTRATHTYKESELGLIPEEWEIVSLDKCSTITNSNVDKKSSVEEQEIKLCNYMDVYVNDEIDNSIDFMVATATELEIKKFTLKKDDVIITKDSESPDDIGIPSYVAEDLKDVICGYHLTMIRPKKNCYGKYLALLLQGNYYKKYFGKLASGSTRFALSLGTISQALITLPSITEQKQIAKILTTQDKKIETEETNLAKLKELKKGLMSDLLSGKVRVKV